MASPLSEAASFDAASLCLCFLGRLIDFLISLVTAHFAESVLEHYVLLEQVVYRHLALSVVVHRALEEEAQEALSSVASCACSQVAEQHEVKAKRSSEDRVAAEEVDFDLHCVAHPSEDVDVVPSFLVVVARWIVVDAHFVVVVFVEIRFSGTRIDSKVDNLLTSLVWKFAGSSSTRPSRLPRMFVETIPGQAEWQRPP